MTGLPTGDGLLIDAWLPDYAVRDVASRVVWGEPASVCEAAKQLDLLGDPLIRALFAVRQAPGKALDWYRGTSSDLGERGTFSVQALPVAEGGFVLLEEEPGREVVLGRRVASGLPGHSSAPSRPGKSPATTSMGTPGRR